MNADRQEDDRPVGVRAAPAEGSGSREVLLAEEEGSEKRKGRSAISQAVSGQRCLLGTF